MTPILGPRTCSPPSSKLLAETKQSQCPAASHSRRPCWAGCTSFDSRNVSPAPRQLAISWNSNPGIPTPTDSHLQPQQRSRCWVWVSPGGHISLPGLGEEARVVCGMKPMQPMCIFYSPGCLTPPPEGTDGQRFPWAWHRASWREPGRPTGPCCPLNPRPDRQAASSLRPARATRLERTTGLLFRHAFQPVRLL